jgi:hypothetical protein
VTGFDDYVPVSGLGGEIKGPKGCGRRDTIDGVQFRVIELSLEILGKLSPELLGDLTDLINKTEDVGTPDPRYISKLRNLVAHACFRTPAINGFARDPFSSGHISGVPDSLRSEMSILGDCEAPLALIYLTSQGIQFVDMWSVRRRLTPGSASTAWPLFAGERRLAEAEAVFLQFQDQIKEMNGQSKLTRFKALDYFRYLPSCGIIPITSDFVKKYMADNKSKVSIATDKQKGFAPATFFQGMTCRDPVFIEGAKLHTLLHESLYYPPVDLNSKEMLWLYFVRENIESVAKQNQDNPYLLFTTGHMPYKGNARFDSARWDYSNYAFI